MKKISLVALTTLVALLGFQPHGEAAAPRAAKAAKARMPALVIGTDLRCTLEAFTDAGGTQPLANNGTEINLEEVWVRASVRNAGAAEAKTFSNTLSISKNGSSVQQSSPELTIPGGFTMTFPLVKVFVGHSGSLEAKLQVDTDSEITESVEYNNTCTFKTKSQKLH